MWSWDDPYAVALSSMRWVERVHVPRVQGMHENGGGFGGVSLTRTELFLLHVLREANGNVVQSRELVHKVWGYESDFGERHMLRVNICRLRRKLPPELQIETRIGEGYRLVKVA
jgi:DNA-binding response OmpR family regulator